jgi:putative flippase GtrA
VNQLTEWRPFESPVSREFVRYLIVGGFAFACDATTLYVLTAFLGVYFLISAVIGFVLGLMVNYLLSRSWVFERRTLTNTSVEVTVFSAIGIAGLGLNEAILWTFQDKLRISYLIAKGVSGVVVFLWNFAIRKVALFR